MAYVAGTFHLDPIDVLRNSTEQDLSTQIAAANWFWKHRGGSSDLDE